MPKTHSSGRQLAKLLANVYRDPINPSATFRELRYIQEAALKCMVASGFVEAKSYEAGLVVRTKLSLPDSMLEAISAYLEKNLELSEFVLAELATIPLKGLDGLKDRTGLMEYRYDVA
ncbi:ABC-three component system middle component 5 [Pseudomonas frederiksbergensis]|uniref:ABC-three component system middle component 5 n=1 Tax=Pseudomonas frederiksbergensis TaxID=104087 RepID=UPI001C84007E|nr:ABC-three component system middle component 5 [Pseudomonas frederiksbergensis]